MSAEGGRTVFVSHWLEPGRNDAAIHLWPIGEQTTSVNLRDRLSLMIVAGPTTVALHPTPAEAQALLAALVNVLRPALAQVAS